MCLYGWAEGHSSIYIQPSIQLKLAVKSLETDSKIAEELISTYKICLRILGHEQASLMQVKSPSDTYTREE